jgi:cytochrome c oxidase subunit 4
MAEHIVPRRTYFIIFTVLLLGTYLTVQAAYIDLGRVNPYIALTIALIKATLVVLFFMHVKYGTRLTWVVVSAGFFWLCILFALTLTDYLTRGWLPGFVNAGPVGK